MKLFSQTPLVSVVIPSYNHESFVEEAVQSALDQTIENIEVIVVDDGSSDATVAKVSAMRDPRIRLTSLQQNRAQHARNLGIHQARGKYIAFLNSDDVWEKNKLELQMLDFKNHPDLHASFTRVAMILPDNTFSQKTWAEGAFQSANKTSSEWLRFFFECGNDLCISSAVLPRSIINGLGLFNESLVQLSDIDMWIRIAMHGEILVHDEPLTRMRINGKKNLSAPHPKRDRRSAIELARVLRHYASFDLAEAFFDIIPTPKPTITIQQAILAKHAWSRGPSHVAFGDALFADLLEDPLKRSEIVTYFGADIIHQFLENRTKLEVIVHG